MKVTLAANSLEEIIAWYDEETENLYFKTTDLYGDPVHKICVLVSSENRVSEHISYYEELEWFNRLTPIYSGDIVTLKF